MRADTPNRPPPSANRLPTGTATRLTTGMLRNQRTNQRQLGTPAAFASSSGSLLNAELNIEERPITGAQGLKSAAPKSSFQSRRQVEDRGYFIGVLRGHINSITAELTAIATAHEKAEEEVRNYGQYERMAENLATELRALQGELGDYNTLVDKATVGHDISAIEIDWEDLKAANDRAEISLERFFEERKKKETQLKALESEIEQEKKIAESVIEDMDNNQRAAYLKLKDLNDHFHQQLSVGQIKLSQMSTKRSELELDISMSKIKQEAMRILGQLREAEAKRDQLLAVNVNEEDPQAEKERLLAKIKGDNREMANMDREISELKEKICADEYVLNQLTDQLNNESANERTQKILELQRREAQIDAFFSAYESSLAEEAQEMVTIEDQIVQTLEKCSQFVVSTEQTMEMRSSGTGNLESVTDQLNFKSKELTKSASTAEALDVEKSRLQRDLQKIDQLEGKITEELQMLKKRIASMEADMKKFNNLTSISKAAEEKKATLIKESERVNEIRENLAALNSQQKVLCTTAEVQLNAQETYLQLCALEKRLIASEETKRALSEAVAAKKADSDFQPVANKAKALVMEYNEVLKSSLRVKPVGL
ncbi:hypothetical protein Aperf_G00000105532 [Anoplocephala perfoliata]